MLLNLYPEFLILIMFLFPEIVFGSPRNLIVFIFALLLFSCFNTITHPSWSVFCLLCWETKPRGTGGRTPWVQRQATAFNYEGKPGLIPLLPPLTQAPFSFFLPHSQLLFFKADSSHGLKKKPRAESLSPHPVPFPLAAGTIRICRDFQIYFMCSQANTHLKIHSLWNANGGMLRILFCTCFLIKKICFWLWEKYVLILNNINSQVYTCRKWKSPWNSFPGDNIYFASINIYLHKWAYATDTVF